MDHPMTVGAQEAKVTNPCFVAWFQRVNGLGVMAFDKAFAVVAISVLIQA